MKITLELGPNLGLVMHTDEGLSYTVAFGMLTEALARISVQHAQEFSVALKKSKKVKKP